MKIQVQAQTTVKAILDKAIDLNLIHQDIIIKIKLDTTTLNLLNLLLAHLLSLVPNLSLTQNPDPDPIPVLNLNLNKRLTIIKSITQRIIIINIIMNIIIKKVIPLVLEIVEKVNMRKGI